MHGDERRSMANPGVMLLSAAIFAYFGFGTTYITTGANGQFLFFVALLEWTAKTAAVAFALSALLTFVNGLLGNLVYTVVGLLSAVSFVVVALLDWMDPVHTVLHPLILLIFAAWNGYGSWEGLTAIRWELQRRGEEKEHPAL